LPKLGNNSPHSMMGMPPLHQQPVVVSAPKPQNMLGGTRPAYTQEQQKHGNQLYQHIKLKYPQDVAKLTGMILTMHEEQIRNFLANPAELDKECEKLVQILKNKKSEVIHNILNASSEQRYNTNLASLNNPLFTTTPPAMQSSVPTFIATSSPLTNLHPTTTNFGGTDPNLMPTYPHTFGVTTNLNPSMWPGVGVVNNISHTNYNFVTNPNTNVTNDAYHSVLPNSNN